jgi:hypothetical protein
MMVATRDAKLEEFKKRVVGKYTREGSAILALWLGEEPGLYDALAGTRQTPARVAERAGCSPQLARKLLDGQVAAGRIDYHPDSDSYSLNPLAA